MNSAMESIPEYDDADHQEVYTLPPSNLKYFSFSLLNFFFYKSLPWMRR